MKAPRMPATFARRMLADLRPLGALEGALADRVIVLSWRLRGFSGTLGREEARLDRAMVRNLRELRRTQAARASLAAPEQKG